MIGLHRLRRNNVTLTMTFNPDGLGKAFRDGVHISEDGSTLELGGFTAKKMAYEAPGLAEKMRKAVGLGGEALIRSTWSISREGDQDRKTISIFCRNQSAERERIALELINLHAEALAQDDPEALIAGLKRAQIVPKIEYLGVD